MITAVTRKAIVLLVLASLATAQTGGAVLMASGTVSVNNIAAAHSAALTAGDKIQTGPDGAASITVPGAVIGVIAASAAIYNNRELQLDSGVVAVSTNNGYSVKAGSLLVSGLTDRTRYEVRRMNCRITVVVAQGEVKLSDGTVIRSGNTATRREVGCAAPGALPKSAIVAIGAGAVLSGGMASYLTVNSPYEGQFASPSKPRR